MKELDYFARIAGDNPFREWLEKEQAEVARYLRTSEGTPLYRAQGRAQLLDEIRDRLEKAKGVLHTGKQVI